MKKHFFYILEIAFTIVVLAACSHNRQIEHDLVTKTIFISDEFQNLSLMIDYSEGCKIVQVNIRGENTVSPSGVFTAIRTADEQFTSDRLPGQVKVSAVKGGIEIGNIAFGNGLIHETWTFKPGKKSINWTIRRTYAQDVQLEDMAMPVWNFSSASV